MGFTSAGAVANACKRLGVQLAHRRDGDFAVPVVIAKEARPGLDEEAAIRRIDRKELAARLLNTIGALGADHVDDVLDDMD
ncbi:hypothetical protein [Ancylobacter defluvii]|nr:hypothetical protein [Ancylobacter defluvii]